MISSNLDLEKSVSLEIELDLIIAHGLVVPGLNNKATSYSLPDSHWLSFYTLPFYSLFITFLD